MRYLDPVKPFLKCNFHCHTTCSDGLRTPEEAAQIYRDAGYDVLAITDHRKVTHPARVPEGLLTVPGIELDYMMPHQCAHVLGLGMKDEIAARWDPDGTPRQGVDEILRLGGQAILAHPAWSLNTPEFIASLKGICGAEIWNTVSTLPMNADRADSSSLLDVTSASYGVLLPVFANDDVHFYESDQTFAATMVQAEEKTVPGVLNALKAGRFYATLGPAVSLLEVADGEVRVCCSEACAIIFYSNLFWVDGRSFTAGGYTQSRGRHAPDAVFTEARYRIQPGDTFVRVEIRDRNGKKAWTAPIDVRAAK